MREGFLDLYLAPVMKDKKEETGNIILIFSGEKFVIIECTNNGSLPEDQKQERHLAHHWRVWNHASQCLTASASMQ